MKRRIYYFTGTGNSMRAARVIANKLGNTEIISMRSNPIEVSASDCDVVGFIYPVYHWTMPAPAVEFVKKLQINPNAYVFVIAMPSLVCGVACESLAGILKEKGINIDYGNKVHCVANYAIVYPPFPSAKIMIPMMERKLKLIAEDIYKLKKKDYPRASWFIKSRRNKVMTPYLKLQEYADYPFVVNEQCIRCGMCSKVCPCKNIILENDKPIFQHHCCNCMACVVSCPKRAIGYVIDDNQHELLKTLNLKTPIVKLMGLPKSRKLYKNPYVTASDLCKDKE